MPHEDDSWGPDIDIFVTFRCGLRCTHCFMGDNLGATDMPLKTFQSIVRASAGHGTQRVTLLGGEPTLYPHLMEAVSEVVDNGLQCRIVTNGQRAFQRALQNNAWPKMPYVCFSVDGSTSSVHDGIRGDGSFSRLAQSVALARERSLLFSGIVSVSRRNASDVEDILRLCRMWGMEYVNVHYVTNRGYGKRSDVLDVAEWLSLYQAVSDTIDDLDGLEVRIEKTFGTKQDDFYCAVKSRDNLMFLPDGRVFHCMMFIDIPDAHSYWWRDGALVPSDSSSAESVLVGVGTPSSCPALPLVNRSVSAQIPAASCAQCIYKKERLAGNSKLKSVSSQMG